MLEYLTEGQPLQHCLQQKWKSPCFIQWVHENLSNNRNGGSSSSNSKNPTKGGWRNA
jgi:hypothetical protein